MNTKVRRGLGLLVVAVIAFLATGLLASAHGDISAGAGGVAVGAAYVVSAVVMVAAFFGGLLLLAWGLLRGE